MSAPNPLPRDRIRVFDKSGMPVTEFAAAFDRSWAIDEEGRGEFVLPTRLTAIANPTVLRYGNWILVENTVLPPWVGMLDTPRTWSANTVTCSAYTPEHQFTMRLAPIDETITHDPGGWFRWFIEFANTQSLTILQVGNIHHNGKRITKTVCQRYLSEYLQEVIDESGEEYEFIPQVNRGQLTIIGNWSKKLGVDTQCLLKSKAGNLEDTSQLVLDDGPLANDVFILGDGADNATRPYAKAWDQENIAVYGMRHYTEEATGITKKAVLQSIADRKLAVLKQGVKTFSLNAINLGDTFKNIRLGNRFHVLLDTCDFNYDGTARITAMRYNPLIANKVECVLEAE